MMNNDHVLLKKGDLAVSLCRPDATYHGSRFDHGVIFDNITWKDHVFTTVELPAGMPGPDSHGTGMINEMRGIEQDTFRPDAMGTKFAKLCVGTLVNDQAGPYRFMHEYPIAEPCTHEVLAGEDHAVVVTHQPAFEGYAATLVRDIRLEENALVVTSTLVNTGDKPLETMEYNHNFMLIDGHLLGEGDYTLRLADSLDVSSIAGDFVEREGHALHFVKSPEVFEFGAFGPALTQTRWQLTCGKAGVGLREMGGGETERIWMWGKAHVVSAEAYVKIQAPIAGCAQWTRKWEFFKI